MQKPLSEILRPKCLKDYIGQAHLMGEGASLRLAIESGNLHSMILWGPPGVGKTTLALLIAEITHQPFYMLSAINSGVKEVREIIEKAKKSEQKPILFIDEIHRFSKAQQDSLLGAVEQGIVTLIGATTENPSFEVISPLLSRCQVHVLQHLSKDELSKIIHLAQCYFQEQVGVTLHIKESEALMRISGGDARKLLNAIELIVTTLMIKSPNIVIDNTVVKEIIQRNLAVYDKKGENHYDIISAFIKSMRGSDPNAAVYWLARMLAAGEDPLFIARRMIILASEDIGNANPNALLLANNCFQAVHHIGMPEARIILSQTAIYLASSPKSNASYLAIDQALALAKQTGDLPVPMHLRNAPTQLMKELGYHDNYRYAHDYAQNFVEQEFLPQAISGTKLYEPQNNARENELRKYLSNCWRSKYHYCIIWLISLFFFSQLNAQDLHFSQFTANSTYLNAAHTGCIDGTFRAGVSQRTQWLAVTKPYLTFSATADAPVYKNNNKRHLIGMGIALLTDRTGDSRLTNTMGNLSIGFTQSLDRKNHNKISIGGYIGFLQRSINYAALSFDEQFINGVYDRNNPISEDMGSERFTFFDCGAGLLWQLTPNKRDHYEVGVQFSHLNQPNLTLFDQHAPLHIKTNLHLSTHIGLPHNFAISPAAYVAFQHNYREIIYGTQFAYEYQKRVYSRIFSVGGGLFHRWNDAIIVIAHIQWENLRFGVSYDFNHSSLRRASQLRGGMELSLYYTFKKRSIRGIGHEPCPFDVM